jgi:hypothetical protein
MFKQLLLIVLILCGSVFGLQAQRKIPRKEAGVRIRKDKPGVYLSFHRVGEVKVPEVGEGNERIWLRFHNNTRWPVMLDMGDVESEEYGDAQLFYDVLKDDEVLIRRHCHVCTHNELGSGKSITFSIPRGYLTKERSIRVNFSYGWEDWTDVSGGREALHYAVFDGSSLPKS